MTATRARPAWLVPIACAALLAWPGCGDRPAMPPQACIASAGGMSSSADEFEPNDDLVTATEPAAHAIDCGMTERRATISGAADVDVFRTGACDVSARDQPTAELFTDDPDLRLCLIFACDIGTTTVFSCSDPSDDATGAGVVAARTEGGFRGCCRTGGGALAARVQCSGYPFRNHAVKAFVWIDSNGGGDDTDHDYRVRYRMN